VATHHVLVHPHKDPCVFRIVAHSARILATTSSYITTGISLWDSWGDPNGRSQAGSGHRTTVIRGCYPPHQSNDHEMKCSYAFSQLAWNGWKYFLTICSPSQSVSTWSPKTQQIFNNILTRLVYIVFHNLIAAVGVIIQNCIFLNIPTLYTVLCHQSTGFSPTFILYF
jgi:hypothetical protein